jgi:hypothetical protein
MLIVFGEPVDFSWVPHYSQQILAQSSGGGSEIKGSIPDMGNSGKRFILAPVVALNIYLGCGPIAQLVEPPAHNRSVPGSSPGGPTREISEMVTVVLPVNRIFPVKKGCASGQRPFFV